MTPILRKRSMARSSSLSRTGTRTTTYHPPSTCNHAHEGEKNGLDLFALIEQHRGGKLDGSVHGEIGVGDDFEARACFRDHFFRAAGGYPGKLHLRESGNLGDSAERKGER